MKFPTYREKTFHPDYQGWILCKVIRSEDGYCWVVPVEYEDVFEDNGWKLPELYCAKSYSRGRYIWCELYYDPSWIGNYEVLDFDDLVQRHDTFYWEEIASDSKMWWSSAVSKVCNALGTGVQRRWF